MQGSGVTLLRAVLFYITMSEAFHCNVSKEYYCTSTFSTFIALQQHIKLKHEHKICSICNEDFYGSNDLAAHYRTPSHKQKSVQKRNKTVSAQNELNHSIAYINNDIEIDNSSDCNLHNQESSCTATTNIDTNSTENTPSESFSSSTPQQRKTVIDKLLEHHAVSFEEIEAQVEDFISTTECPRYVSIQYIHSSAYSTFHHEHTDSWKALHLCLSFSKNTLIFLVKIRKTWIPLEDLRI